MHSLLRTTLLLCALAAPAAAQPSDLAHDAHVTERLVAAKVGDTLRKACPDASVRWMKVWNEAEDLKAHARAAGHTEATVKAFLKDPDEKARINGLAADYLSQAGYTNDAASACAVARAEIQQGTLAGGLLRMP
jgi:Family of unknown function (DUF5333)